MSTSYAPKVRSRDRSRKRNYRYAIVRFSRTRPDIAVRSFAARNTDFYVELTFACFVAATLEGPMRILLVEDELLLRQGLVDLFRGAGHEIEADRKSTRLNS